MSFITVSYTAETMPVIAAVMERSCEVAHHKAYEENDGVGKFRTSGLSHYQEIKLATSLDSRGFPFAIFN
jgi:hypothetical protein